MVSILASPYFLYGPSVICAICIAAYVIYSVGFPERISKESVMSPPGWAVFTGVITLLGVFFVALIINVTVYSVPQVFNHTTNEAKSSEIKNLTEVTNKIAAAENEFFLKNRIYTDKSSDLLAIDPNLKSYFIDDVLVQKELKLGTSGNNLTIELAKDSSFSVGLLGKDYLRTNSLLTLNDGDTIGQPKIISKNYS